MKQERSIDLDGEQYRTLKHIIETHIPNKEVWAYGSRVKWKASIGADLDLAVFDCDFSTLAAFREALEESNLVISVDVMNWEKIPNNFKENIKQKYVVVQKKRSVSIKWQVVKLEDAPLQIIDNDRGINYPKKTDFCEKGYCLFLNTKNVTNLGFSFSEKKFITKEKDQILRKGKLMKNDVVLTTRGTIGNIAFYDEKVKFENIRINSGMVIIRPSGINPKFNFQLFKNLINLFSAYTSGSAQPQLPIKDIKKIEILLPPLSEQESIAEVLSSLDDKIDLLRRQNKTLEKTAEMFFYKQFIKSAYDKLKEVALKDLCIKITSGGTPLTKNETYYNGDINWYTTKELNDNFLVESDSKITLKGLNNSSAKLFPRGTVLIAIYAAPTVGRLGILTNESTFNQAACGLIADDNKSCKEFIYLYLKSQREKLNKISSGSAQQNLNVAKIKDYPVIFPPMDMIKEFKEIVTPLFSKIEINTKKIRSVKKMRDMLLPKLMNGKIKIQL